MLSNYLSILTIGVVAISYCDSAPTSPGLVLNDIVAHQTIPSTCKPEKLNMIAKCACYLWPKISADTEMMDVACHQAYGNVDEPELKDACKDFEKDMTSEDISEEVEKVHEQAMTCLGQTTDNTDSVRIGRSENAQSVSSSFLGAVSRSMQLSKTSARPLWIPIAIILLLASATPAY